MVLVQDLHANGKLRLTGPDRARFLHGMVTNDVTGLAPGRGCHAAMLTLKGKLLGDLRIYAEEDALLVETDPEAAPKIRAALEGHLIMDEVEIAALELPEVGLFGDGARAALERALGPVPALAGLHAHARVGGALVVASRGLGRDGFRV